MLKIATWNVNSLRVRLAHLLTWLENNQPDIIALQETKIPDEDFPQEELLQAGYHSIFHGQRTYNGVAILSKVAAEDPAHALIGLSDDPLHRRALAATINQVRIVNFYVPNGESVTSEKYQYKLNWLRQARDYLKDELKAHKQLIVLGDFNIAPEDRDIHDPKAWRGQVLASDAERTALQEILALGFIDSFRLFEHPENIYSWWDYRGGAYWKNKGLRIDLILVNNGIQAQCSSCWIDKKPRGWLQPSDHAPVVLEMLTS